MTTYTLTGDIVAITPTHTVGQSGLQIRDVVIDTAEASSQYRNPISCTARKDRCHLLDGYKVGDRVSVRVTIDGRKWVGDTGTRYYTTLTVWGIERIGAQAPAPTETAPADPLDDTLDADPTANEPLPF